MMVMSNGERASLGGKASAIIQKKKALDRYYANPTICLQCNEIIEVKEGQLPRYVKEKKFCNHSCAAKYTNKDKYDWEEVRKFYDAGNSQCECAKHFGFENGTFRSAIKRGALKIQERPKIIPLEKIMVENSAYNRGALKERLLESGILENKCSICGITEWMGKPLVMVLDHINGINNDHRLENLRMVCQNCNSQLPTFAGRNIKRLKNKVR